ncbi:MAG: hypothetical protein U5K43_09690 [Halofilum sp. (in: g-proteobacteria)]|nr:hypothetical protein [Halofilum sp. (in: g-proteobacteria)]
MRIVGTSTLRQARAAEAISSPAAEAALNHPRRDRLGHGGGAPDFCLGVARGLPPERAPPRDGHRRRLPPSSSSARAPEPLSRRLSLHMGCVEPRPAATAPGGKPEAGLRSAPSSAARLEIEPIEDPLPQRWTWRGRRCGASGTIKAVAKTLQERRLETERARSRAAGLERLRKEPDRDGHGRASIDLPAVKQRTLPRARRAASPILRAPPSTALGIDEMRSGRRRACARGRPARSPRAPRACRLARAAERSPRLADAVPRRSPPRARRVAAHGQAHLLGARARSRGRLDEEGHRLLRWARAAARDRPRHRALGLPQARRVYRRQHRPRRLRARPAGAARRAGRAHRRKFPLDELGQAGGPDR